jgi:DNA-binding IclR family transcriptional regulator
MESVSNVGVLDKAISVLHAIERRGPLSLVDLQATTELPRATLHRLAVALERHGLLRRDHVGRFCLGLGLVALGHVASDSFPIAALSRPRLAVLCEETGESVQLYVRDGERRRCAVSFPSPHGLRWMVGEGALLPLHLGSAGRVLTGEVGREGWVETVEEREAGVASVSAPIAAPSTGVLAAVSVGGPIERLSREPGKRFGAEVVEAAADIAATLQ